MNYYEHHLGDYLRDTAHLSMLEDAAYRRLLDRIYSTEEGIPQDQVYRVVRAKTKDEQAAVDAVLAEFFTVQDGRYVQGRAMAEIARYQEGEPEREAKRANERDRQRRTREGRQKLFEELRSHGITPRYDTTTTELKALLSRVTSRDASQKTGVTNKPVTREHTATQSPIPSHHIPEEGSLRSPSGAREEESPEPSGSETHRTRDVPRGTSGFDGWAFVDQRLRPVYPRGTFQHPRWIEAARTVERLVESGADPELIAANAAAYCKQAEALGRAGTQWVKAPNRWLESGDWQGPFDIPPSKAEQQVADVIDAGQAWLRKSGASA